MTPDQVNFLFHIYDALRQEIILKLGQMTTLAQFAAVASGAIWSWLVTKPLHKRLRFFSFVPFVTVALLALQYFANRTEVHNISTYIQQIEKSIPMSGVRGWEGEASKRTGLLDYWMYIYWSTLILLNGIGSIVLWVKFPSLRTNDLSSGTSA